jgi:hypothetical protein
MAEKGDELYKKWLSIILAKAQKDKESFKNDGFRYVIPIFNTLDNLYKDHRRYDLLSMEDLKEFGDTFYSLIVKGQKNNPDRKEKRAILEAARYFTTSIMPDIEEYHRARQKGMNPEAFYRWKDAFVNTIYNQYIPGSAYITREESIDAAARVFDYYWDLFDRVENFNRMSAIEQAKIFTEKYESEYKGGMDAHDSENLKKEMVALGPKFTQFMIANPSISSIKSSNASGWPTVQRTDRVPEVVEDNGTRQYTHGTDSIQTDFFKPDMEYFSSHADVPDRPPLPGDLKYVELQEHLKKLGVTNEEDVFDTSKYTGRSQVVDRYGEFVKIGIDAAVTGIKKALKDTVIAQITQLGVEYLESAGRKRGGQFGKITAQIYDSFINKTVSPMFNMDFDKIFGEDIGKRVYDFIRGMVYDTGKWGKSLSHAAKYHAVLQLTTQLTNRFTKRYTNKFMDLLREKLPTFIASRVTSTGGSNDARSIAMFGKMLAQGTYSFTHKGLNDILDKKLPNGSELFKKPGATIRRILEEHPDRRSPDISFNILNRPPSTSKLTETQLRGKPVGAPRTTARQKRLSTPPPRMPRVDTYSFSNVFDEHTRQHPIYTEVVSLGRLASLIGKGSSANTKSDIEKLINSSPAPEREKMRHLISTTFKDISVRDIPKAAKARLDSLLKGARANIPSVYEGNLLKGFARSGLSALVFARTQDNIENANILSTGANAINKGKALGNDIATKIMKQNLKEDAPTRVQRAFLSAYVEANRLGYNQADALLAGVAATTGVWGTSGNGNGNGKEDLSRLTNELHLLRNDKKATDLFIKKFTATFGPLTKNMKPLGQNQYTLRVMDTLTKGMSSAAIHIFNSHRMAQAVTPPKPLPFKPTTESKIDIINRKLSVAHRSRKPIPTQRRSKSQLDTPTYLDYGIVNALSMFPGGPDDFIDGIGQIAEELKDLGTRGLERLKRWITSPHALFYLSQIQENAPMIGTVVGGLVGLGNPVVLEGGAVAGRLVGRAAGSLAGHMIGQSIKKWGPAGYRALTPPLITSGADAARAANAQPQFVEGQSAGVRKAVTTSSPRQSAHKPARRTVARDSKPELDLDLFTATDILQQVCTQIAIDNVYGAKKGEDISASRQRFWNADNIEIATTAVDAAVRAALDNPSIRRALTIRLGSNATISFGNSGISTDIDIKGNMISLTPESLSVSRQLGDNVAGTIMLDRLGILSAMLHHGSGFSPHISYGFKGSEAGPKFGISYHNVPLISFGKEGMTIVGGVTRSGGRWSVNRPAMLTSLINLATEVGINVWLKDHKNNVVRHFAPPMARAAARAATIAATKQAMYSAAKAAGKGVLAGITPVGWLFAFSSIYDAATAVHKFTKSYKDKRALTYLTGIGEELEMFGGKIQKKIQKFMKEAKKFGAMDLSAYEELLNSQTLDEGSEELVGRAHESLERFADEARSIRNSIKKVVRNTKDLVKNLNPKYVSRIGGEEAVKSMSDAIKKRAKKALKFIEDSSKDIRSEEKKLRLLKENYRDVLAAVKEGYTGSTGALARKGREIRIERDEETPEEKKLREMEEHVVDTVETKDGRTVPITEADLVFQMEYIDWDHLLEQGELRTIMQRAEGRDSKPEASSSDEPRSALDLVESFLDSLDTNQEAQETVPKMMSEALSTIRTKKRDAQEQLDDTLKEVFDYLGIDVDLDRLYANMKPEEAVRVTPQTEQATQEAQPEEEEWSEDPSTSESTREATRELERRRHEDTITAQNEVISKAPELINQFIENFKTTGEYLKLIKKSDQIEALCALLNKLTSIDIVDLSDDAYDKVVVRSYIALELANAKLEEAERSGDEAKIKDAKDSLLGLREKLVSGLRYRAKDNYEMNTNSLISKLTKSIDSYFAARDKALQRINSELQKFYDDKIVPRAWMVTSEFSNQLRTFFRDICNKFVNEGTPGPKSDEEKGIMLDGYKRSIEEIMDNTLDPIRSSEFNGYSAFNKAAELRGKVLQVARYIDEIKSMDDELFEVARLAAISQGDVFAERSAGDTISKNLDYLEGLYSHYSDKLSKVEPGSDKAIYYSNAMNNILNQVDRETKQLERVMLKAFGSADRILGEVYNTNGEPLRGLIYSVQELLQDLERNEGFSRMGTVFSRIMNELNLAADTVINQVEERLSSADIYSQDAFRSVAAIDDDYSRNGYSRSMVHELTAIATSEISPDSEIDGATRLLSEIETHIARDLENYDLKHMRFDKLRSLYRETKTDFDNPLLYYISEEYYRRKAESPSERDRNTHSAGTPSRTARQRGSESVEESESEEEGVVDDEVVVNEPYEDPYETSEERQGPNEPVVEEPEVVVDQPTPEAADPATAATAEGDIPSGTPSGASPDTSASSSTSESSPSASAGASSSSASAEGVHVSTEEETGGPTTSESSTGESSPSSPSSESASAETDGEKALTLEELGDYIRDHYDPESRMYWEEFRTKFAEHARSVSRSGNGAPSTYDMAQMLMNMRLDERDELIRYISQEFSNEDPTYYGILYMLRQLKGEGTKPTPSPSPVPEPPQSEGQPEPPHSSPTVRTTIEYIDPPSHIPTVLVSTTGSVVNPDGSVRTRTVYNAYYYDTEAQRWGTYDDEERAELLAQRRNHEVSRIILSFDNHGNSISIESPNIRDSETVALVTCDDKNCVSSGTPITPDMFRNDNNINEIINRVLRATNPGNIPIAVHTAFENAGRYNASRILLNNAAFAAHITGEEKNDDEWDEIISQLNRNMEDTVFESNQDGVGGHHQEDPYSRAGRRKMNPGVGVVGGTADDGIPVGRRADDYNEDVASEKKRQMDQAEDSTLEGAGGRVVGRSGDRVIDTDIDTDRVVDSDLDQDLDRSIARDQALVRSIARARAREGILDDAIPITGVLTGPMPVIIGPAVPIIPGGGGQPKATPTATAKATPRRGEKTLNPPNPERPPSTSPSPNRQRPPRSPKMGFPPEFDPLLNQDRDIPGATGDVVYEPLPWAGKMLQSMLRKMSSELANEDKSDYGKNLFDNEED